jgi:hypothetical protein
MDAMVESEIKIREMDYFQVDNNEEPFGGGSSSSSTVPDRFEVMSPLLVTKWGQLDYNDFCPEGTPFTGCVVTAISQICSFLQSPVNIKWTYEGVTHSSCMEWSRILNECALFNGLTNSSDLHSQISDLMRLWGLIFEADYQKTQTSVNSESAINKMIDLGYNATKLTNYNIDKVIDDLKSGNKIVYMRGNARYYHVGLVFRKYVDGHGWVVDGYIDSVKDNEESIYVHCNWGWYGDKNGYFLSNVLNAEENPVFNDDANETRSSNFRYKLKTSTLCK